MRHEGRSIAITGGAGDIGRAMAGRLAREGAEVTLLDLAAEAQVQETLAELGPRVRYRRVDVRDRESLDAAFDSMSSLDIAIGNAGIVRAAPFLDVTQDDWRDQLDVNLTGAFNLTQAAAQQFVTRRQPGLVLLTGSWVGEVPWPEISAYSTSKAGLAMLARSAARELAAYDVRVNVVAPGIVRAGLAKRQLETDPQYAARVAKVVPLGRLQTADDVAAVTSFLCSDDASYLTGSTLLADGGCSLFQFD